MLSLVWKLSSATFVPVASVGRTHLSGRWKLFESICWAALRTTTVGEKNAINFNLFLIWIHTLRVALRLSTSLIFGINFSSTPHIYHRHWHRAICMTGISAIDTTNQRRCVNEKSFSCPVRNKMQWEFSIKCAIASIFIQLYRAHLPIH